MLAVGRGLHIVHHLIVDGVGAAGNGAGQSAAPAHRVKVLQLVAGLGDGAEDGVLAVVRLVDDPLEPVQLLGGVVDAQLEQLLLLLEHRDLRAGGAGVDDKDLHVGLPLFLLFLSVASSTISPNYLVNYSQYYTFPPVCQRRFSCFPGSFSNISVVNKKKGVQS